MIIVVFGKHATMSYFRVFSLTSSNAHLWSLTHLDSDQGFSILHVYYLGNFSKLRFRMGSESLHF